MTIKFYYNAGPNPMKARYRYPPTPRRSWPPSTSCATPSWGERMSKYWARANHRLTLTDVSPAVFHTFGSEPGHMMATTPRLPWAAARAYLETVQRVLDTGAPAACVIEPREGYPGWLYCWPVLGGVVASYCPFDVPEVATSSTLG